MNLEIEKAPQLSVNARHHLEKHRERHRGSDSEGLQVSMALAKKILDGEMVASERGIYYLTGCTKDLPKARSSSG